MELVGPDLGSRESPASVSSGHAGTCRIKSVTISDTSDSLLETKATLESKIKVPDPQSWIAVLPD